MHHTRVLIWVAVLGVPVALLLLLVVRFGAGWGFASRDVWDWMELLLIPVVLALGASWLQRAESRSKLRVALEAERRDLLATYFDRMQELLLEHGLDEAAVEEEVCAIGRARTLHALRSLDSDRKGYVIRFLVDVGVLARQTEDDHRSIFWMSYADLSEANLHNIHLEGVNLWCASLENADLTNAHLVGTSLSYAFMRGVILDNADLSGTVLTHAVVTPDQLRRARNLDGATMPNGILYEDWVSSGEPDWSLGGMPRTWTSHESR